MGIYVIDANLNTLYANQALLDIFGYKNIDEIRVNPLDKHYTTESRVGLVQRREKRTYAVNQIRINLNSTSYDLIDNPAFTGLP